MNEPDFWTHLEFRLCDEMAGSERCKRRGLWCDGIDPLQYWLGENPPRIEGLAWIGSGSRHQEEWHFTLLLPRAYGDVSDIDWAGLLPPQGVTDWLAVDLEGKRLELRPGAAVPDSEHKRSSLQQLQHTVQRIALGAADQIAQFPDVVVVADELALDFDNWYRVCESSGYLRRGHPSGHLQLLDAHLNAMSGGGNAVLWTIEALHHAPGWKQVRRLALDVLGAADWPQSMPPTSEQDGNTFVPAGE